MLTGHRLALALAFLGLSLATLLKLIPPAATKAVIDYVILAHPVPDWFNASSRSLLPVSEVPLFTSSCLESEGPESDVRRS